MRRKHIEAHRSGRAGWLRAAVLGAQDGIRDVDGGRGVRLGAITGSELARRVAEELTAANALEAHARDELGITETLRARPLQAAFASAAAFVLGSALPLAATLVAPAARTGGASVARGAVRVVVWGAVAMLATAFVGRLFHVKV